MKRNRGKRRILAVVLTIALAAGSLMVSSPVKAAETAEKLLARYELLTDVQDRSGNGRHGTSVGNVSFGSGADAGMVLPGGTDSNTNYVSIPGEMFAGQEYLTISAWIKSGVNAGNWSALFFGTEAKNHMPVNYWLFNPYSPQKNFKSVFTDSVNEGAPYNSEAGLNQTPTEQYQNVWTHYTTVITPTSITGYINGERIGTTAKSRQVSDFGTNLFAYIGRSNYMNDWTFQGSFQDVCIYGDALSEEEIRTIMGEAPADNTKEIVVQTAVDNLTVDNLNGVTSDLTLADTAGYGTVVTWESSEPSVIRNDGTVTPAAEDKTVTLTAEVALGNVTDTKVFTAFVPAEGGKPYLHYDFSRTSGTTVTDISGNGHDGTIRGTGYSIAGDALTLPGGSVNSEASYVEIPSGTFDNRNTLTVSLWLKNETGAGNYSAMFFGNASNYWLLNPCNPAGYYKSVITNSENTGAPYHTEYGISPTIAAQGIQGPATDAQWALYTTIIQPGSITAYYNNTLIGTVETSRNVSDFGENLVSYIGKSTYPDPFYKGGVRDVRVYTYSMDQAGVANIYYEGLGDETALDKALQEDVDRLTLPYEYVMEDISLPTTGVNGAKITWSSSNSDYLDARGKVTLPTNQNQEVTLTAALTLGGKTVTKEFPLTVLADTPDGWLTYYMEGLNISPTTLTADIELPSSIGDGAAVTWSSDNEALLTKEGKVTRPDNGTGDKAVTLTASVTYQGVTREKVFHLTVAQEPYGRILTYVRSGNTDRTDALHIGYSEDKGQSYQALYNNQPILYPSEGTKMMGSPVFFRKADGTYGVIADDNHSSGYVFLYDSDNLTSFTNSRYVRLDASGKNIWNVNCIYNEERNAYEFCYEASDGKSYVVYTTDFEKFTQPEETIYQKAAVNAELPEGAIECGVFEVTKEEYDAILKKYSRVVNTSVSAFETVTVQTGTDKTTISRPSKTTASYSDGTTKDFGIDWNETDWANVDTSTPGTYTVRGTLRQPDYGNVLVEQRADPYVVKAEDGSYYFTASYPVCGYTERDSGIGYDRIILRHADTIEGLADAEEVTIWSASESEKAHRYIWAPEMHYIGGSWYMIFTASRSTGTVWDIRPHMLKCVGDDPMNPDSWKTADESNLHQVTAKAGDTGMDGRSAFSEFSLDMTYFESAGRHYVAWAEKPGGISKIYLAEINPDEPWQLISDSMLVSTPDFAWEWEGGTIINEGPAVLKHDGKIHLCFSGAAVDYTYCVGMVTAEEGADLLNPDSWTKYPTPLLKSEDFEVDGYDPQCGPGHNSFTYDKDGNPVIVYHARPMNCSNAVDADGNFGTCEYVSRGDDALSDPCRHARAKSLNFAADGTPILNMTLSEELSTKDVSLTIVVEDEKETPVQFYAARGIEASIPAQQIQRIISVDDGAVCEAAENAITFTGNVCGEFTVVYEKTNGEQVTIHVNVYAADHKAYVLDYGLTADLNASGEDAFGLYRIAGTNAYGMTGINLPAQADAESGTADMAILKGFRVSGTQDDWQMKVDANGAVLECTEEKLLYTPTAFMEDADVYEYQVEVKKNADTEIRTAEDGVAVGASLTVVPATVVYYEDDFSAITVSGASGKEGTTQDMLQSNHQKDVYGYDAVYGEETPDSAGGSTRLEADSTDRGTMTFTFNGTGFDVVGRSTADTAGISLVVRDADKKVVKSQIVDTVYQNGNLYQLPIISVKDLEYGTYTATIRAMRAGTKEAVRSVVYIDGIRIYYPAGVGESLKAEVGQYYQEKEAKADIAEIRELLLGKVHFENLDEILTGKKDENDEPSNDTTKEASVSLAVFDSAQGISIYHGGTVMVEGSADGTGDLEQILKNGPNNEVYLRKGNAIAFCAVPVGGADDDVPFTLQAEVKKAADEKDKTAQLTVLSEGAEPQVISCKTHTAMYYEIDLSKCKTYDDGSYLVVLASTGEGMLSLTNLKSTGYQIQALTETDYADGAQNVSAADTYLLMCAAFADDPADDPVDDPADDPADDPTDDPTDPPKELPFTDVGAGSWYETYVRYVYQKGIMTGMEALRFGPAEELCRAQFAVVLYRMEGSPKTEYKTVFKDVGRNEFYTDAVMWASEQGIVTGYTGGDRKGYFGPADSITREQMVTMLYRYASAKEMDTAGRDSLKGFPDSNLVSGFAEDAVRWAVEEGLLKGDQGMLRPQGNLNRAECAAIIQRFMENK